MFDNIIDVTLHVIYNIFICILSIFLSYFRHLYKFSSRIHLYALLHHMLKFYYFIQFAFFFICLNINYMMIVCLLNAFRETDIYIYILYLLSCISFLRNFLSRLSFGSRIYDIIIMLKDYCNNNSPFSETAEIKKLLRSTARRALTRARVNIPGNRNSRIFVSLVFLLNESNVCI